MRTARRLTIGHKMSERLFATGMVLPALIILAVLFVYPLFLAVKTSFYKVHTILRGDTFVGLDNYMRAFSDPLFRDALGRSVIWTLSVLVFQLMFGLAIAILLNQELMGRNIARGLVLFPWLVPSIVAAIVWRYMFNPLLGIANYLLVDVSHLIPEPIMWLASPRMALPAVIIVGIWKWLPFMVVMFLARLQTIPLDLYDAAKVDGANAWQEFRYVTLAWLSPTIIVAMLLRSIWLFNHFDLVYLLAFGGPVRSTTTVPLLVRDAVFAEMRMGKAAALSMIMTVIMVLMAIVYFYYYGKAEEELRH